MVPIVAVLAQRCISFPLSFFDQLYPQRLMQFPWSKLPALDETVAADPLFYVGFVACFGWWWVLLGRPAFATK